MYRPNEYKHKVYNIKDTTLQEVCDQEPMLNTWQLYKVIEVSPVERVAIFITN